MSLIRNPSLLTSILSKMLEYLVDHHLPCHHLPKLVTVDGPISLERGCLKYENRGALFDQRIVSIRSIHSYLYVTLMEDGTQAEWYQSGAFYRPESQPGVDQMIKERWLSLYFQ